jgi:tetratricopeptide (TPR) repeat protein
MLAASLCAGYGCKKEDDTSQTQPEQPAASAPASPAGAAQPPSHPLLGDADQVVLPGGGENDRVETELAGRMRRLLRGAQHAENLATVTIDYPLDESIFPPETVPPTFLWHDSDKQADTWLVEVTFSPGASGSAAEPLRVIVPGPHPPAGKIDAECVFESNEVYKPTAYQASARSWTVPKVLWQTIKKNSIEVPATVTIRGFAGSDPTLIVSSGSTTLTTSKDPVGAPIFYRDVPLGAFENESGEIMPLGKPFLPMIAWRLKDVSRDDSRLLLTGMYTCANCHSFSADGQTLGMDIDGPTGDKGAYGIAHLSKQTLVEHADIISWNSFKDKPEGQKTIGFMSRISPDGSTAVTTVNEEVYVRNFPDYKFLQVFYPTRGILAYYSKATDEMKALPGADDRNYVQCDPVWTPDGKEIIFARAKARPAFAEDQKKAMYPNDPNETQMQYDLYRIPFNGGAGGEPEPIEGASNNGMSNTFPKVSPDGKWIVFVKCRNGQLMRPDSTLWIVPARGGEVRKMRCNMRLMNSWHSFSPNGRWMVFASKANTPYTQMFLTHIDADGKDSPAVLIPNATVANRAINLPEFVNRPYDSLKNISVPATQHVKYLILGIDAVDAKQIDKARDYFAKAVAADPTYVYARINLALIMIHEGKATEAEAHLRKALELDGDNATAHNLLGLSLQAQERLAEATASFTRALEIIPRFAEAEHNLGEALCLQGQYDDGLRHYRQSLAIQPGSAHVHGDIARVFNHQGRHEQAIEHCLKALEIDPTNNDASVQLGQATLALGQPSEAASHFRKVLQRDGNIASAHYGLGMTLRTMNKPAEAIGHFRRALELRPKYAEAHNELGNALVQIGRIDEAIEQFQKALAINPRIAPAHNNIGIALAQRRKFDQAAEHFTKAVEIDPKYAAGHLNLGRILRMQGQTDRAAHHLEQAASLDSSNPAAMIMLGDLLVEQGKFAEALPWLRQAARIAPNHPESLTALAWLLAACPEEKLRDGAEALKLAERACQITNDRFAPPLDAMAAAQAECGRFADAVRTAERALKLLPADAGPVWQAIENRLKLYRAGKPYRMPQP